MAKYVYPAVFTKEENGQYSVVFHDLEGCYTCGDSLEDAIEMAENEFRNFIRCDTMQYRKMYNSKAVNKTLTLPEWLNEEAMSVGIHFSQVLQDALMVKLGKN